MPAKFKDRLHHHVPAGVAAGATFHVRVRGANAQLARAPLNEGVGGHVPVPACLDDPTRVNAGTGTCPPTPKTAFS